MDFKEIEKMLKPLADVFGVAVKELWGIFVRKYLVRGFSEIVLGVMLGFLCFIVYSIVPNLWVLLGELPVVLFIIWLIYDSIQYLVNPQYFALNEIILIVKKNSMSGSTIID